MWSTAAMSTIESDVVMSRTLSPASSADSTVGV